MTPQDIKAAWEKYKHLPKDTVIQYTTDDGTTHDLLVGYLKYMYEYVLIREGGKRD